MRSRARPRFTGARGGPRGELPGGACTLSRLADALTGRHSGRAGTDAQRVGRCCRVHRADRVRWRGTGAVSQSWQAVRPEPPRLTLKPPRRAQASAFFAAAADTPRHNVGRGACDALARTATLFALGLADGAAADLFSAGLLARAEAPALQAALLELLPRARRDALALMEVSRPPGRPARLRSGCRSERGPIASDRSRPVRCPVSTGRRDETRPVSTEGGTRRVQLVRKEGRDASS